MITKYRVSYNGEIEAVKVLRETKQFVVLEETWSGRKQEHREKKEHTWFDSWQQAFDFLETSPNRQIDAAKRNLQYRENALQKLRASSPPATEQS